MGRMLETLRSNGAPQPPPDSLLTADSPEPDPEMPFVEVGGPRPAPVPQAPHLESAAPSIATLQPWPPRSVVLQPAPALRPRAAQVAADLIAFHQPDHAVSAQYAAMLAQMTNESNTDAPPVLLLTGLAPRAGTTTVVLNLAVSGCRQHQQHLVVVDANRIRPAVAQRLGLGDALGLAEVLEGKVALEKAVQATLQPGLSVLPAGAATQDTLWSPEAMRWMLAWLRQRFDVVLVDAPSADGKELCSLIPAVDAVYLVVDSGEAEQPQVRALTRAIAQMGSRFGGTIVTH
jgi:Mrp family chromosome partitioning ATPase